MKHDFAVFITDGINRHRQLLPLSTIAEAMEAHVSASRDAGRQLGVPLNFYHDRCRPCGWSRATGIHLASDCARQIGVLLQPTEPDEVAAINAAAWAFDAHDQARRTQPYVAALAARVPGGGEPYALLEAATLCRPRVAAELYPDFFNPANGLVDADGLVDYRILLTRTRRLQAGVFHDPDRDLVIFAHQYFRRSLSRRNALNGYVLDSFHRIVAGNPNLNGRLRLDPDVVGHPESVGPFVELEYWRGPHFDEDIAAIPNGVAEHRSTPEERILAAVDKTQIWWKLPETRLDEARGRYEVRTFEVEELIENPSYGLGDDLFGCRYAHAEYDLEYCHISHFDGAIRAYPSDDYLTRIDLAIDRAGKRAEYTKIFRIDGALKVADWKRLLNDHYRGNQLIPEYLGAPADIALDENPPKPQGEAPFRVPALAALITFDVDHSVESDHVPKVIADNRQVFGDVIAPIAEIGSGAIADLFRTWIDPEYTCLLSFDGALHNLATVDLGSGPELDDLWKDVSSHLSAALDVDVVSGVVRNLSLAFRWRLGGIEITLSFAGKAENVACLLREVSRVVRPNCSSSSWSEDLHAALRRHAPPLEGSVYWPNSAVTTGRLILDRSGRFRMSIQLPEALRGLAEAELKDTSNTG